MTSFRQPPNLYQLNTELSFDTKKPSWARRPNPEDRINRNPDDPKNDHLTEYINVEYLIVTNNILKYTLHFSYAKIQYNGHFWSYGLVLW